MTLVKMKIRDDGMYFLAVENLTDDRAGIQRVIGKAVCAPPPQGMARWSVRLIATKAVKRKLAPQVGLTCLPHQCLLSGPQNSTSANSQGQFRKHEDHFDRVFSFSWLRLFLLRGLVRRSQGYAGVP
jgi:hypothetical protein